MPDTTNPTTPEDDEDEQRPETDCYPFVVFGERERRMDELGPYDTDRIDAGPWS